MRRIYIDGDSSGKIDKIERVAGRFKTPVTICCNGSQIIDSTYSDIVYSGSGPDMADFTILRKCKRNDIVVTMDFGLAAMALAIGCKCYHPNGQEYTDSNINELLAMRDKKRINHRSKKHFYKRSSNNSGGISKVLFDELSKRR